MPADRDNLVMRDRSVGKEAQQIYEMTGLADDTTAANLRVLSSVSCGNFASVHRHDEAFGLVEH